MERGREHYHRGPYRIPKKRIYAAYKWGYRKNPNKPKEPTQPMIVLSSFDTKRIDINRPR
jgi:hypothetical protein